MARVIVLDEGGAPIARLPRDTEISMADAKRLADEIKKQGSFNVDSVTVSLTPHMKVKAVS